MKTETFRGKDKQDLDKKIWDWKLTPQELRREENTSYGKFAH
jgi:hypothetical protein